MGDEETGMCPDCGETETVLFLGEPVRCQRCRQRRMAIAAYNAGKYPRDYQCPPPFLVDVLPPEEDEET